MLHTCGAKLADTFMQLLRLANLNTEPTVASNELLKRPSIVTIGNFDGMHLGHQSLLRHMQEIAASKHLTTCVVIFEPQPKEFFMSAQAPGRISPFRDKISALKTYRIDQVLCLNFNKKTASLTAEHFVEKVLINRLNAKHIIVGNDFKFGKNREGDITDLKALGERFHFEVSQIPSYIKDHCRVSSSKIRVLIEKGQFDKAKKLLGHAYTISGRVHRGKQKGRELGFPTINLPMPIKTAISGVCVVKLEVDGKIHYGIANIGTRPTVCGQQRLLEVHIFNFHDDLYGQYVRIEFLHFIRAERKFNGLSQLITQIEQDKSTAESWLDRHLSTVNTSENKAYQRPCQTIKTR